VVFAKYTDAWFPDFGITMVGSYPYVTHEHGGVNSTLAVGLDPATMTVMETITSSTVSIFNWRYLTSDATHIYPAVFLNGNASITYIQKASVHPTSIGSYSYTVNLRRYENGTLIPAPYTATIVLLDGTTTYLTVSADATPYASTSSIYAFTYPLPGSSLTRTLYYPTTTITPLVPNNPSNSAYYVFTVRDPTNYLKGKTGVTLEATRIINGTEALLGSNELTTKNHQAYFTLEAGNLVHLVLKYANASVYDFGYFTPTGANLNNYLDLYFFGYTSGLWHVGQLIQVDSYWSGSDIVALYGATRATTINANITIRDRVNSTVIYFGSALANTTWTVPADSSRSYIVELTGSHSLLGSAWTYVKILDPTTAAFPAFPTLPTNWTLGGLSMTTFAEFVIPIFFLFMFSYKWRNIGMIAAMLIATVQWGIGWAPFWTWGLLAVGWAWALGWSVVIMESG
jgi:hypothetical protein